MVDAIVIALHNIAIVAGFWGIVLFAFAQEVIPPIPSTIFAITLGFAIFAGAPLTPVTLVDVVISVGVPIALGLTVGAIIIYGVFYWGGRPFLSRYGKYIGVTWNDIENLRVRFEQTHNDEIVLFVARAFPLVPSVALNVFAGLIRWPLRSFIILTFTGTIVRGFLGALIGWQTGSAFIRYAETIERVHTWVVAAIILALVGFIGYRIYLRSIDIDREKVQ